MCKPYGKVYGQYACSVRAVLFKTNPNKDCKVPKNLERKENCLYKM